MDIKILPLNDIWKFHLTDIPNAWKKDYNDSEWQSVSIPHDWSVSLPFSREYSSGTGYVAGGIGWYRGFFSLPESYRGKRILLSFDGISKNSQVWCNSYYKGFHPNGYTPFSYDITDDVVFGDELNEVSVRVDHTEISDSRWFTGAGITRKVTLLIMEPIHLNENGMFFSTPHVTMDEASLQFENEVINKTSADVSIILTNELFQKDGIKTGTFSTKLRIPALSSTIAVTKGILKCPKLWSVKLPYLYTVKTNITLSTGETYLCDTSDVGVRSIHFDPDMGFFLNGSSMKLKGVCVHHDAGALGAAVTKEVWVRRLLKLKTMGCNAIRMSHNPHMAELYDLCDRIGFLVIDEAFDEWEGPKNKWSTGHNVYPPRHEGYYHYFPDWHERDLTAMIKRDRNHPCVILWSIGNEIDYPNDPYCHPLFQTMTGNNDANKPAAEREYSPDRPNAERLSVLAKQLSEVVRQIDTTHPVTLAAAFPELSSQIGFLDHLDVAGYNYKEHLYEDSHRRFPNLPFLGSENSHSYEAWMAVTQNTYISGQFLWTGIDYLGEAHGWPARGSGAGILNLAAFEKPGYYRRMSFWTESAMAHLVTAPITETDGKKRPLLENWNYKTGEMIDVCCYTNLPDAELFLNGKSLGKHRRDFKTDGIYWQIPFSPGKLIVCATSDNASAEAKLETVYAPCLLALNLFEPPEEFSTDEPIIIQAEVSVLDCKNRLVITDSSLIHVSMENGTLIGLENGDISDCTEYTSPARRANRGHLLIYAKKEKPSMPMVVNIYSEALSPACLKID